ncbi:NADH dehydrogenase Fe-S protein subunit 4 ndufs4 [Physocladia obscura]|uniref:NADH dehydrogenase [ubiquinone] iron-sulfur protein 4, mitochondrial n=1 Tax=Physocladia obscura TaxID=109957 RepID=A0AAD5T5K2_9FUNG|nr:NADH dehydrogenase Fe-S protein subunit 4 ndufs4 [Physocladia obscura]
MQRITRSAVKQGSVRSLTSKPSEVAAQHLAAAAADPRRLFQAELESGVPASVINHPVRIYRPANTPTQSGSARPNHWRLDFDTQDKWENKLIGWVSRYITVREEFFIAVSLINTPNSDA